MDPDLPSKDTKNEIDYSLPNRNNICLDVTVRSKLYTGRNDRLGFTREQNERNSSHNNAIQPLTDTDRNKQTEYQNESETRITLIGEVKQMTVNEVNTKMKETISVKKVCSKSKITKTYKLQHVH